MSNANQNIPLELIHALQGLNDGFVTPELLSNQVLKSYLTYSISDQFRKEEKTPEELEKIRTGLTRLFEFFEILSPVKI